DMKVGKTASRRRSLRWRRCAEGGLTASRAPPSLSAFGPSPASPFIAMNTNFHQYLLRLGFIVLVLTAAPCPAMPWILRQQQTAAAYQNGFDIWTAALHGYRLVRQCGSQTNNAVRYTSLYEKNGSTAPWVARSG